MFDSKAWEPEFSLWNQHKKKQGMIAHIYNSSAETADAWDSLDSQPWLVVSQASRAYLRKQGRGYLRLSPPLYIHSKPWKEPNEI